MKIKVLSILFFSFPFILSCGVQDNAYGPDEGSLPSTMASQAQISQIPVSRPVQNSVDFIQSMERIAEIERSGSYFQGLALFESSLREEAGDYSGAVFAAYKELSWLYGHGGSSKVTVTEGISSILSGDASAGALVNNPAQAVLAFAGESWQLAANLLNNQVPQYDEPDSFYQWMLLVCLLENGQADHAIRGAYGAIRARYSEFPEYWYRGARTFTPEIAAVYAEHCINLSADGPFSAECRNILTCFYGLEGYGEAMRTMSEIERYVQISVSENNPAALANLFPLLSLPDNKYTHYALGALQSLSPLPVFRDYFVEEAVRHTGRLAERLAYISRGIS